MSGTLQRCADGRLVRCATTGVIRGPCEPPGTCCHCGNCCYSPGATLGLSWSFAQPPEYAGWSQQKKNDFDALASGSYAAVPLPDPPCPWGFTSMAWQSWLVYQGPPAMAERYCETDSWRVLIGDMFAGFTLTPGGTCCQFNAAAGTFFWMDPNTWEVEETPVTGTVAGQIANNACCHDSDPHGCRTGPSCADGNTDGQCQEEGI